MLEGALLDKTVDTWMTGYKADFFDSVSSGDFFQGNDKDINGLITPIINENNDQIKAAELRIDTGALDLDRISRIRQVNQKPYLNI